MRTTAFPVTLVRHCVASGAWSETKFLVKAARPGFWPTAMWFYVLALGADVPFDSPRFWLGLFYVGFPLGLLLYAVNDLTDTRTDALNPRKGSWLFGARPSSGQIRSLPLQIALVQAPFLVLFVWLFGVPALAWLGAVVVASLLYNVRGGAKDRPFLDLVAQSGYLLVFVLAAWLNGREFAPLAVWIFGALFAMHSHGFGQIMDIVPDAQAGRRTTAVCLGVRFTKWLLVAFLLIEVFVAFSISHKPWLAPFCLGAALFFALDVTVLWREKPYRNWQMSGFFLGWNALLAIEIAASVWMRNGARWPF